MRVVAVALVAVQIAPLLALVLGLAVTAVAVQVAVI
jgi:hypothetical protein